MELQKKKEREELKRKKEEEKRREKEEKEEKKRREEEKKKRERDDRELRKKHKVRFLSWSVCCLLKIITQFINNIVSQQLPTNFNRSCNSLSSFKSELKTWLFKIGYDVVV